MELESTIKNELERAVWLQQQNLLDQAKQLYQTILTRHPTQAWAIHGLGMIAFQEGDLEAAIQWMTRSVRASPQEPTFYSNLGMVLGEQKRFADAHHCLGQAIGIAPQFSPAYINLGHVCKKEGRIEEAKNSFLKALSLDPTNAEANNNLGVIFQTQHDWLASIDCFQRAIAQRSNYAEPYFNLAVTYDGLGDVDQVLHSLKQALRIRPHYPEAYNLGGKNLFQANRYEEAMAWLNQAISLRPDFRHAMMNLASVYHAKRDFESSLKWRRTAFTAYPHSLEALIALLHEMQWACDWEEISRLTSILVDKVDSPALDLTNEIVPPFWFLCLTEPTTSAQQQKVAERWARRFEGATRVHPKSSIDSSSLTALPKSDRRIRVGYLSADFGSHATTWLIGELFQHHDRQTFEIFAYSLNASDGSLDRRQVEATVEHFCDLSRLNHLKAVEVIRGDQLDILVDLKGYTDQSRPEILACRPAPIQIAYLGFPGTMGASFIDYGFVDDFVVPGDRQAHYPERLVHLPGCYQVNGREIEVDSVLPAREACGLPKDAVVLCAFNNAFKLSPAIFEGWMRILQQVPRSILWLFDEHPLTTANLIRRAESQGIPSDRLVFAKRISHPKHLARHVLADLFVDTFPVSAHTTASDALRMGLPIVTLVGEAFASRVAGSLLNTLGLQDCVTNNLSAYESRIVELASDQHTLESLKQRLRESLQTSQLFRPAIFAKHLEDAFRRCLV
jgi:protein O-GlcNAc transferase